MKRRPKVSFNFFVTIPRVCKRCGKYKDANFKECSWHYVKGKMPNGVTAYLLGKCYRAKGNVIEELPEEDKNETIITCQVDEIWGRDTRPAGPGQPPPHDPPMEKVKE